VQFQRRLWKTFEVLMKEILLYMGLVK